ncbi:related to YMD8 - putative nucleotide sugar transporter [Pseudozyma flocculosa]|uniref:Related to YMD8 - putative nucleotide sugar transporter n=1 Tax=Pseudozyma flocculosa TaxID=84751 RepID=A0A5C3F628_9BASI|nr:related to YMD8 - putative nucleotide sugar transporter [Pseudozyma flocculosa]
MASPSYNANAWTDATSSTNPLSSSSGQDSSGPTSLTTPVDTSSSPLIDSSTYTSRGSDARSHKSARSGVSDDDEEGDAPIYFAARSSAERVRSSDSQATRSGAGRIGGYLDEEEEDGSGEAGLLSGKRRSDTARPRYDDGEDGRTATARALEHVDGGTTKERKRAYWRAAAVNLTLIGGWYTFSTLISIYNKWMFSPDRLNFSFPLFVTTCHMVMQFILASLAMKLFDEKLVPRKPNGERARPSGHDWASKVVPCAAATALDIGLSNTSLKTITLTFYTMCKSSNLAFVLFFAFLFRLEIIRWSLIGIIALITIGVVMMVAAETKFVLVGAVQVLTASAMGGLRWTLTQMLLDRDGMGLNNPIATIFWLAPVMGACLVVFSAIFEDWHAIFGGDGGWFDGLFRSLKTVALITAPGVLAFGMNLSEFALIQRTSVVTLSVAGIFKEVLTIMIASTIFGDELTPINITGLCIALVGIGLYNYLKYRLITQGPTAFSRTSSSTGLNELSESLRSRASSLAHSLGRPRSTRERGSDVHSLATTRGPGRSGGARGGYDALRHDDGDGDGDAVLFDRDTESVSGRGDAVEIDTHKVSVEIVSAAERQREKERQEKIQEEADLAGWDTSGERETGNGYVER